MYNQVLGRSSTSLPDYVKFGMESGFVEIELKGCDREPNTVIKRTLSAKQKNSKFELNGESATGKEVSQAMARLSISVDNLW